MALNGVHVAFGYAGDMGRVDGGVSIRAETTSSQTMQVAGTSAVVAPPHRSYPENPLVSISTSVEIFYAVGKSPDASAGSAVRDYLKAGDSIDRYCRPDDKVAWIAA